MAVQPRRPDERTARQRHAEKVIDMQEWLRKKTMQSPTPTHLRGIGWKEVYREEVSRGTGRRVLMP